MEGSLLDDSYSKHVLDFPKWMIMEQWLAKPLLMDDLFWGHQPVLWDLYQNPLGNPINQSVLERPLNPQGFLFCPTRIGFRGLQVCAVHGCCLVLHGFCAEEVVEFVDFLQNPKKYQQLGDWEDWESSEVQEAVEQCWIIFFDAEFLQLSKHHYPTIPQI